MLRSIGRIRINLTTTIARAVVFLVLVGPVAALAAGSSALPPALTDGLVAYYPFEGNADDFSPAGDNDGSVNNGSFSTGRIGQGVQLTGGETSNVEVSHRSDLSPAYELTVSTWVKPDSFPNAFSSIIYKAGEKPTSSGFKDRVYTIWVANNGGVHLTSTPKDATSQAACNTPGGLVPLGEFTHIAGIIDALENTMEIYVNGVSEAACTYPGDQIRGGSHSLRIGGYWQTLGNQSGLDGVIDEVRIYNRILSSGEIVDLFEARPPAKPQFTPLSGKAKVNDKPVAAPVKLKDDDVVEVGAAGAEPFEAEFDCEIPPQFTEFEEHIDWLMDVGAARKVGLTFDQFLVVAARWHQYCLDESRAAATVESWNLRSGAIRIPNTPVHRPLSLDTPQISVASDGGDNVGVAYNPDNNQSAVRVYGGRVTVSFKTGGHAPLEVGQGHMVRVGAVGPGPLEPFPQMFLPAVSTSP